MCSALLLSLLPPSCIVVPIREVRNIMLFNTTSHSTTHNMAQIQNNNMVIDPVKDLFPDNEVRGHSLVLSMHKPKSLLISLSESKEEYHVCIQKISDKMDEDDPIPESNINQVEDTTLEKRKNLGSKTTDNADNILHQRVPNEVLASSPPSGSDIFNIQLNYDINQALDPRSWDSEFYAVSLHGSMEHLASNVKNIKESL